MTPLRRCAALGLAAALACGSWADEVHEGQHVTLVVDPALEACGDIVGHMDHFVATLAAHLGVSLPGKNFAFIWFSELEFLYGSRCPGWGTSCTKAATVLSAVAPLDYELARLVLASLGSPPSFYAVGAAVAFAPDTPEYGSWAQSNGSDIQEVLARGEPLEWTYYLLAGKFTRYLIERHGLDAYIEFYAMITREDSLPVIEAAHAEQFGESLTETIVAFDAEGRGCPADRVRFKLVECGAPPIAWDGDSLLLRRALACGDADVVGPFADATARAVSTVEVATAGSFTLSLASDDPGAVARLGSCGGCEHERELVLRPHDEPARRWLPAGRYYLQLSGDVEAVTTLALRLERVEEP
jgi:hypothetical protein